MSRKIISRLGGIRPLARLLKHQSHTTVQGWWERDMIPAQQQAAVLDAARVAGVEVTPADMIPNFRVAEARAAA